MCSTSHIMEDAGQGHKLWSIFLKFGVWRIAILNPNNDSRISGIYMKLKKNVRYCM